ncbi:hypothetical protein THOG11_10069 [Vibrio harveyi]|nr:hypothetical protein TH15OA1_180068 [Vibrio harveyi]CAH1526793.1 hypothetical protein VHARVF571_180146 [Vibrio harveyi]CAH1547498.1 hypothetical protein THOD03_10070 [Vibrio harveyi]CAH1548677.1 hypothetical protein THOG11_10069 [Vibrio harveyi]
MLKMITLRSSGVMRGFVDFDERVERPGRFFACPFEWFDLPERLKWLGLEWLLRRPFS